MPPFLLSWAYPAVSRMGWLSTMVANPSPSDARGVAYLFRGNGTIFTPGFGRLTDQLRSQGLWAEDLTCNGLTWARQQIIKAPNDRPISLPIILIGHSCGGRSCLKLAALLEAVGVAIDLLICIDVAFTTPVPANVRRAVHLYRSCWRLYPARPLVPCPGNVSPMDNIDLDHPAAPFPGTGLNHFNITNSESLQRWIVREVKNTLTLVKTIC